MSQALWMRLREVTWSDHKASEGTGERIPRLLQDISSRKIPRAIKPSRRTYNTVSDRIIPTRHSWS